MRILPGPLLLLVPCVAALPAQARHPFAGRVLRLDGAPAAAAELTFTSTAAEGDAFRPPDVVRVAADASGRFHADLQVGRDYSGTAVAALPDADGVRRGSPVLEDLAPGQPGDVVLSLPCRPRTVVVANAAAWAAVGVDLRLAIGAHARNFVAAGQPVPADGRVALPLLPGAPLYAQVLDAQGGIVWQARLRPDAADVPLPPPQPLPVRVLGPAGAPLAGAVVWTQVQGFQPPAGVLSPWLFRREYRRAGTTGPDGLATVHVARAVSPLQKPGQPQLLLVAQAPGCAEGYAGFDGERFEEHSGERLPDRLTFVLEKEQPRTGVVRGADGKPIADAPVFVRGSFGVHLTDLIGTFDRTWCARTDREGHFVLGDVPPQTRLDHVVVGAAPGAAAHSPPPSLHPRQLGPVRELTIDDRLARAFRVQVLDATGTPAAHALLRLQPVVEETTDFVWGHVVRADAAGRCELRVPPGEWVLAAHDGLGYAEERLDELAEPAPLELHLAAMPKARLRVLGPDGEPARDATASMQQIGWEGQPSREAAARHELSAWLDIALLERARCDASGMLVVPFVPRAAGYVARVSVTAPGRGAVEVDLRERAEPEVVPLPAK